MRVWRDTADLWPGENWRARIRNAITENALVFIACFSRASISREKSYQNEELTLAIEQLRQRRPDDPWLIPVRLDSCSIPDRDIGGGLTLASLQRVDLFDANFSDGLTRLVKGVLRILGGQPSIVEPEKVGGTTFPEHYGSHLDLLDRSSHHGSHRKLLWPGEDTADQPGIDAIIVPTVRPPSCLTEAANLAMAIGCTLVTLHSSKRTTAAKAAQRLPPLVDLIAIDVPDPARTLLPPLATSRLLAGTAFAQRGDLSAKRNLGLILSHLCGWSRVFILGEDITAMNPADIWRASGLLNSYNAVGLHIGGFPEDSVVSHAFRQMGGHQQSFISGKALAVCMRNDNSLCPSFFPEIYHDDWFFLLNDRSLQPLATVGEVKQRPYDPFRTPDRARAEELGDVLSEGLYWLLDQGQSIHKADGAHWVKFLVQRKRFIEHVLQMTELNAMEPEDRARRVTALRASLNRLARITPELCTSYLRAWSTDRRRWQQHLRRLPTDQSIGRALALLSARGPRA